MSPDQTIPGNLYQITRPTSFFKTADVHSHAKHGLLPAKALVIVVSGRKYDQFGSIYWEFQVIFKDMIGWVQDPGAGDLLEEYESGERID